MKTYEYKEILGYLERYNASEEEKVKFIESLYLICSKTFNEFKKDGL